MNSPDTAQLSPQQADRFWKGKPTRREVQNGFETINHRLANADILLGYLAEKDGVTKETLTAWLDEKSKKAAADALPR